MWHHLKNNPNKFHFLAYCLSFLAYGAILTGLGPLIPYLAEYQHVNETQYSFFFLARTIGFVVGALLIKIIEKYLSFHHILVVFSTLIFINFGLFSWETNMTMQGIYIFLGSVFSAITEIVLNVSILTSQKGEHQQFYVQISHGMFGVGGFFSPLIVLLFEQRTYFVLSLMMFLVGLSYQILQTPEKKNKQSEQIFEAGNLVDEIKRIQHRISQKKEQLIQQNQRKNLVVYLICFLVFLYIGQQVAVAGWISSYAVMKKISTKQQATTYSTIFWGFITIFRFILAFLNYKPSKKLRTLVLMQICSCLLVIIMVDILHIQRFAIYFAAISYGISFSAMFGLFFILPGEHSIQVTTQQTSSFFLYGQMGEGFVCTLVGYLMSWFNPNMLHYSILVCGLLLLWAADKIQKTLVFEQKRDINQRQMTKMNGKSKLREKLMDQ